MAFCHHAPSWHRLPELLQSPQQFEFVLNGAFSGFCQQCIERVVDKGGVTVQKIVVVYVQYRCKGQGSFIFYRRTPMLMLLQGCGDNTDPLCQFSCRKALELPMIAQVLTWG